MLIIPLRAVPTQNLSITLNNQACTLNVYGGDDDPETGSPRIYVDLYVSNVLIEGGMFANIGTRMVRDAYLNFSGDILITDTMPSAALGPEQAQWEGLGGRWIMAYLFPGELSGDC